MKPHILHFILICLCILSGVVTPVRAQSAQTSKINTIVLDPGHGGHQPGTVWGKTYEKDIVLKVALKLGAMIEKELPGVKVIYTRKTDKFVDLSVRSDIANKAKADLFISIHINAVDRNTTANGTSTWIMGAAKSEANLAMVMKENDAVKDEKDYETRYGGYKPGSPESYIIFSLTQYVNQGQSQMLADIIQKHFTKNTPLKSQGVKEGPFLVLWKGTMPRVLTEMGFMTNANDRKYITTEAGQNKLARSLFEAICEYKGKVERDFDGSEADFEYPSTPDTEKIPAKAPKTTYRIQVAAGSQRMTMSSSAQFGTWRNKVTEVKSGNMYKYYVEEAETYKEALSLLPKVRKKFKDAFIVAFCDGKTVPITDEMKKK